MKHILISLFMSMLALAANAAEVSDSLSRALATYWGASINVKEMTPAQLSQFAKGIEESVSAGNDSVRQAYFQGVLYGARLRASIEDMKSLGLTADPASVGAAMAQVLQGGNVGFTPETAQRYLDSLIAPDVEPLTPASQAEFYAKEMAKPGAITTPSGLVFQTITEGEGPTPTRDQKVKINYVARLSNGEVFDTTDEPVVFDLINLIPGFSEGLMRMQPGGTYRLIIPADLGYGDTGAGGVIPPGAVLDFTVNLLSIEN